MILKGSATSVTTATTLGNATRVRVGVTGAGTLTVAASTSTFDGASAVGSNQITVTSHGFQTGEQVTYANGGGGSVGGLTTATDYYIIYVDSNTVSLATSSHLAEVGTAITLTDGSGASHTLTAISNFVGSVVLVADQVILIDKKANDTIAASGSGMSMTAIGSQP